MTSTQLWPRKPLATLAARKRWAINGGPFGSKLTSNRYTSSGVPVIRGTNLSGPSKFSFDDFVFVSDETANELVANNAHPGDLVFTQRGTVGQVGLIPMGSRFSRFVISQSQMKLTPDLEQVDPLYLYYYFASPETVTEIRNLAMSSGVPHINLEILRDFTVITPPLAYQQSIASILSAYDDLIENCQRRIRLLEDMARGLYREWFVHFRFPGADALPRVDSPLGPIPQGWKVMPFSALGAYVNGYPFKPAQLGAEGTPIIKIKELKAGIVATTPRNPGTDIPVKYLVRDGDLLFSWSADLDAYLWKSGEGLLNQHVFTVLPVDGVSRAYLFHALKMGMPRFRALSLGATMHHIKRAALDQVSTVVAPANLRAKFEAAVVPMHEQLVLLTKRVSNLRRTRDLLLPRLLSGQIDLARGEHVTAEELPA